MRLIDHSIVGRTVEIISASPSSEHHHNTMAATNNCSRAVTMSVRLTVFSLLCCCSCPAAGVSFSTVLDESEKCAATATDLWPCLKLGGQRLVAAAVEYPGEIQLVGRYLSVVPDARRHEGRAVSTRNGTSKFASASASVYSKFTDFVDSRLLRVSLPMNAVTRLLGASESRGKKDKGGGAVLMLGGMMMITTLMSTAFGALALMAAKGLLTSILALMLSAMAVSKKSGHGHARTTYEVINAPHRYQEAAAAAAAINDYKLETSAVVPSEINAQYNTAQTEPIQYGNQQYD